MRNLMLVAVIAVAGTLIQASPQTDFNRANQLFQEKSYDSALAVYSSIEAQGLESAELYFNMGNAYFKKGDLGHAVLYYLRAKRLNPGDDDIAANLTFARGYTRIQMEGVQLNPVYSFVDSVLGPYRLNVLAWISSALFIGFFLLLTVRFGMGLRPGWLKGATLMAGAVLLLSVFATSFKYRHDYLTSRGVVLAEDCPVQSGPTEQSEIELRGAPGLVVQILGRSGEYVHVLFENKRQGWVRRDQIEII
ncbi:MAG: tetratricopeptide repeat protein [candidate division Zixibacteria bacterium]|nr:tetratricopeptide repeat protein [candidate division Zixibacteria bacterium]